MAKGFWSQWHCQKKLYTYRESVKGKGTTWVVKYEYEFFLTSARSISLTISRYFCTVLCYIALLTINFMDLNNIRVHYNCIEFKCESHKNDLGRYINIHTAQSNKFEMCFIPSYKGCNIYLICLSRSDNHAS